MKLLILTFYIIKTTLSQKMTLALIAAMAVLLVIIIGAVHVEVQEGCLRSVSIFGSKPIEEQYLQLILPQFAEIYSALIFTAIIVLCVITTAHIIPDIINTRNIILFIIKPIARGSIITALFTGVTAGMILIQFTFAMSLWLIITAKTGIWNWHFLFSLIPLAVSFSAIYALMIYIGITGKSTGIVTAITLGHVLMISYLLTGKDSHLLSLVGSQVAEIISIFARIFLPGVHELQNSSTKLIMLQYFDPALIIISLLPAFIYLWLSIRVFRKMDF